MAARARRAAALTGPGAPTRPAPAALGRGVCAVVANPVAVLAPLAFGIATAVTFVGTGVLAALFAGTLVARRLPELRRGPAALAEFLESLRDAVLASPGAVVAGLLALLVALLLLTALAAWLRAGMTAVVAEADALAPDGAPLDAFKVPGALRTFSAAARARFGTFFALVNLYGFVGSLVAALFVVPLLLLLTGAIAERPGLLAFSGLLVLVALPLAIVGGAAARVAYLVAAREAVVESVDALAAVGRSLDAVRAAPGRAAVLYLLSIAGAMGVGFAFVLPRLVATWIVMFARAGTLPLVAVTGVFFALQMAATLAFDAAVSASFVALWPQPRPAPAAAPASEPAPEPLAP